MDSPYKCGSETERYYLFQAHTRDESENMVINRKVLADLAVHDPKTFAAIVTEAHA